MEIIVSGSGKEYDEIMHLERDDFIGVMWFGTKPDIYHKYRIRVLAGYLSGNHALVPQPLTLTLNCQHCSTAFTCKINYLTAT